MATVQSSNHPLARLRVRPAAPVAQGPDAPRASPSLVQLLGHLVRVWLGVLLLLLGVALMSTLVLLPVGLPVAFVGVAMIAAPRSP